MFLFIIKPTRCTNFTNLFCHETLHVSDSSSVHHQEFIHCISQQWYMSYRFVDSFLAGPGLVLVILYSWLSGMQEHMLLHSRQSAIQNNKYQSWSCSKAVYKSVWHIPLLSVQWINSWWWTEELSETCGVSWQNKFVKLVHLVGFNIKKFVSMHGHMNVKNTTSLQCSNDSTSCSHTVDRNWAMTCP